MPFFAALEAFYHKALLLAQGELEHLGVDLGCDGLLNLKALTCSVRFCLSTHTVALELFISCLRSFFELTCAFSCEFKLYFKSKYVSHFACLVSLVSTLAILVLPPFSSSAPPCTM